jgi:hypothetical protein
MNMFSKSESDYICLNGNDFSRTATILVLSQFLVSGYTDSQIQYIHKVYKIFLILDSGPGYTHVFFGFISQNFPQVIPFEISGDRPLIMVRLLLLAPRSPHLI